MIHMYPRGHSEWCRIEVTDWLLLEGGVSRRMKDLMVQTNASHCCTIMQVNKKSARVNEQSDKRPGLVSTLCILPNKVYEPIFQPGKNEDSLYVARSVITIWLHMDLKYK